MVETKKGNTILLTIITIATFFVALVGATFAYFTASVAGNDTASSVIVKTASIGTINYVNGNELKLENAYPGATSNEITFSVSSDEKATVDSNYTLLWSEIVNNFEVKEELVYSLKGTTNGAGVLVTNQTDNVVPSSDSSDLQIGSGTLKPGEKHEYTIQLHFKETGSNQNSNQGKSFTGKIIVKTGDNEDVYYTDKAQNGTTEKPEAY